MPFIAYIEDGAGASVGPASSLPFPTPAPWTGEMPEYFRVGPPWGMVNYMKNPSVEQVPVQTITHPVSGASVGGEGIDGWVINNASVVASMAVTPTFHPHYQGFHSLRLNTASRMGNDILVNASIGVPTFGYFGFDCFVYTDVPSFSLYAQVRGSGITLSNTILNDAFQPITTGTWMRLVTAVDFNGAASFAGNNSVQVLVRGAVPSGQLLVSGFRLAHLATAADLMGSYYARASIAPSSNYLEHEMGAPFVYFGRRYQSWNARWPAHPDWDYEQPLGQAIAVGSMIPPGGLDTGQGLLEHVFNETIFEAGAPLLYEKIPNRVWEVPFIFRASGNETLRQMHRAMTPTNVIDFRREGASWVTRFDIVAGQVLQESDKRYERAGVFRGNLRIHTRPWGYSATWMHFNQGTARNHVNNEVISFGASAVGDLPAPAKLAMTAASYSPGNMLQQKWLVSQGAHPSMMLFALATVVANTSVATFHASVRGNSGWIFPASHAFTIGNRTLALFNSNIFTLSLGFGVLDRMGEQARLYLQAGGVDAQRAANASLSVGLEARSDFNSELTVVLPLASYMAASVAADTPFPLFEVGLVGRRTIAANLEAANRGHNESLSFYPVASQGYASAASMLLAISGGFLVAANPDLVRTAWVASHGLDESGAGDFAQFDPYSRLGYYAGYAPDVPSGLNFVGDGYLRGQTDFVVASGYNIGAVPLLHYEDSPRSAFAISPTALTDMQVSYMPRWQFLR